MWPLQPFTGTSRFNRRLPTSAASSTCFVQNRAPPVSLGAERPLLQSPTEATEVHGRDGLGGATYRRDAEGNLLYPEPSVPLDPRPATELILQAAAAHPGELTIAALGPLTNLALAARTDPERIRLIREILWMGGAFRRFGNCSPVAEFNAYADPHAAAIVLEAGVPLRIFPLDVTERIVLKPELVARYRQTPLGRFVDHITGHLFAFSRRVEGVEGMYVHDAATIAYLVEPERFRFLERWVVVETEGRWTRGQTIADLRRPPRFDGKRNALLALDVEGEAPVRLLEERVLKGTGA
ncbi:MAG: hypothetical protein KatS3mg115_0932 [Candidatus Poribacteria bacterium]|nr:MAG: hypothetical protein KatS3mg115_0932 [Candidatus Poribacteria bacterium]